MLVPFVPDPCPGRLLTNSPGRGRDGQTYVKRPLGQEVQLRKQWEQYLATFGLDAKSIAGNADRVDLIVPTNSTPASRPAGEKFELAKTSSHIVPAVIHARKIPTWIASRTKIQMYVLHRHPTFIDRARGDRDSGRERRREKARQLAIRLIAGLYYAYRLLLPYESIAELLGYPNATSAQFRVRRETAHGDRFFAGERCCSKAG
jgi:hypothetical protein